MKPLVDREFKSPPQYEMYYFYVLYSLKDQRLYKGYSSNVGERFIKHSMGGTKSTSNRRPFVLLYVESYETSAEARARERWSKSAEGGPMLRRLLIEKRILTPEGKLNL